MESVGLTYILVTNFPPSRLVVISKNSTDFAHSPVNAMPHSAPIILTFPKNCWNSSTVPFHAPQISSKYRDLSVILFSGATEPWVKILLSRTYFTKMFATGGISGFNL